MGSDHVTFQDVLAAAWTLNAGDRLRLADALWEDVPPSDWPLPSGEWIAEAQRRSAEYDQGRMSAATWSEVQARARRESVPGLTHLCHPK
jgi:putative addiction module component (TIGR02574 family)